MGGHFQEAEEADFRKNLFPGCALWSGHVWLLKESRRNRFSSVPYFGNGTFKPELGQRGYLNPSCEKQYSNWGNLSLEKVWGMGDSAF